MPGQTHMQSIIIFLSLLSVTLPCWVYFQYFVYPKNVEATTKNATQHNSPDGKTGHKKSQQTKGRGSASGRMGERPWATGLKGGAAAVAGSFGCTATFYAYRILIY